MADVSVSNLAGRLNQDRKRERDHRRKWAHGVAQQTRGCSKPRPYKPSSPDSINRPERYTRSPPSHGPHLHVDEESDDYLRKDDGAEWSARDILEATCSAFPASVPCMYSFDAPRGPTEGSQVLGSAITKAVEKYENKVTEKLVKTEYEVVPEEKEEAEPTTRSVEDDFELL